MHKHIILIKALEARRKPSSTRKVTVQQQSTTTPFRQKKQSFILRDNIVIHEAVGQGDDKRLMDLMPLVKKRVYNINAPDEDWCSRSPLHIACSNGEWINSPPRCYIFFYLFVVRIKHQFP